MLPQYQTDVQERHIGRLYRDYRRGRSSRIYFCLHYNRKKCSHIHVCNLIGEGLNSLEWYTSDMILLRAHWPEKIHKNFRCFNSLWLYSSVKYHQSFRAEGLHRRADCTQQANNHTSDSKVVTETRQDSIWSHNYSPSMILRVTRRAACTRGMSLYDSLCFHQNQLNSPTDFCYISACT